MKSKILGDNTLVVTVPKGTEVGRVLVEQAGTQVGGLYYPEDAKNKCRDILYKEIKKADEMLFIGGLDKESACAVRYHKICCEDMFKQIME